MFPGRVCVVVEGVVDVFIFVDVRPLGVSWPLITPISVRIGRSVVILESVSVCWSPVVVVPVNGVVVLLQVIEGLLVQGLGHILQGDRGEVRGSVRGLEAAEPVAGEGGVAGLLVDGLHQAAPHQLQPHSVLLSPVSHISVNRNQMKSMKSMKYYVNRRKSMKNQ